MIEAWFTTSVEDQIIPALMPTPELLDLARCADLDIREMFSIDIPGGASRHTRIKVLVKRGDADLLYESQIEWPVPETLAPVAIQATAVFNWRESSEAAIKRIPVFLLPQRPLFMVPGHTGVVQVEAVDVRYMWQRCGGGTTETRNKTFFDGRWSASLSNSTLSSTLQSAINNLYPAPSWIDKTAYTPDVSLVDRIRDMGGDGNWPFQIDQQLSATGYVLLWEPEDPENPDPAYPYGRYRVRPVQSDLLLLAEWMDGTEETPANKRAYFGGIQPMSGDMTVASEPLIDLWKGTVKEQNHRAPLNVEVQFPYRAVEGRTYYDNIQKTWLIRTGGENWFAEQRDIADTVPIPTVRARPDLNTLAINEPRIIPAGESPTAQSFAWPYIQLPPPLPPPSLGATYPSWDYETYRDEVADLLAKRCEVLFGKTVWAGWPTMPTGCYRATMLRYYLCSREGNLMPLTMTEAAEDEWLLGPDGLRPNHPSRVFVGQGMAQVRYHTSGVHTIGVAPPNCRVFPARITAATRIGVSGNDYWQWEYEFEEVEPNPIDPSPLTQDITEYARSSTLTASVTVPARNLAETGNVYVSAGNSGNQIAPGVLQSAFTSATIEPLPISVGTTVMMCEHFVTVYFESVAPFAPYQRQYWFVMPNAVNVVCNP